MVEKSTLFPPTFFDVILMVQKSPLFRRTFIGVISLVEKSTLFPPTFFDVISMVEKSTLFPPTFFDVISLAEIPTLFLLTFFDVILMAKNSRRFSCVCNFKQLTFARLLSLNFSSKSPCCSPVSLKFESYNFHHSKKNCRKLFFLVFTEQLLYQIIFRWLHCYEVALVKKCNKPLLQKSERKIFDQKIFIKKLIENQREKLLGHFENKSDNV